MRVTATDIATRFVETFGVPDPPSTPGCAFSVPGHGQFSEVKLTAWVVSSFNLVPSCGAISDAYAALSARAVVGDVEWPEPKPVKKTRTRRTRG